MRLDVKLWACTVLRHLCPGFVKLSDVIGCLLVKTLGVATSGTSFCAEIASVDNTKLLGSS